MLTYKNPASGVDQTEIFPDGIRVQFKSGVTYEYTEASTGSLNRINEMVKLAENGYGLNRFINRNRPNYATRS